MTKLKRSELHSAKEQASNSWVSWVWLYDISFKETSQMPELYLKGTWLSAIVYVPCCFWKPWRLSNRLLSSPLLSQKQVYCPFRDTNRLNTLHWVSQRAIKCTSLSCMWPQMWFHQSVSFTVLKYSVNFPLSATQGFWQFIATFNFVLEKKIQLFIRHCRVCSAEENMHSSSMHAYLMVFQHLKHKTEIQSLICMESFLLLTNQKTLPVMLEATNTLHQEQHLALFTKRLFLGFPY